MAKLKVMEAARESTQDVRAIQQQLTAIRQSQSSAEDIIRRFGGSVGLLQGGYGFKEKTTGRPLRYQGLDQVSNRPTWTKTYAATWRQSPLAC